MPCRLQRSQHVSPGMSTQLAHRVDVLDIIRGDIGVEGEVFRHPPQEDLRENQYRSPMRLRNTTDGTFPSSEPEAIRESLKGFLMPIIPLFLRYASAKVTHQSVSRTTAVWPRNRGIRSGSFPRSLRGMTAKAPPPLDSQLTARYCGFTWRPVSMVAPGASRGREASGP